MQATCNNLCARLAAIAFVSIGRCIGIAGFWGNRYLRGGGVRVKRICCDIRAVCFAVYGETLKLSLS
jgi:hypothetical protein